MSQGQGDVVERLDDDDLETIAICIKNGQPGRVTPYEIKAMCEELISLRTLLSSSRGEKGWRLVPEEPTQEMLEAAVRRNGGWIEPYTAPRESGVAIDGDISDADAADLNRQSCEYAALDYRAMLAAAPSAPGSVPTSLAGQVPDAPKMPYEWEYTMQCALTCLEANEERKNPKWDRSASPGSPIGLLRAALAGTEITLPVPVPAAPQPTAVAGQRHSVNTRSSTTLIDGQEWVLVPKEPTEVMINEAQMALDDQRQYLKGDLRNMRNALRRAISAAPQPTAGGDAP